MIYLTDLEIENHKIYQDTEDYGFSQDSVLLASLAEIKKSDKVLDLGCGTGILCFLTAIKKNVQEVLGVDFQKNAIDLAEKSLQLNNLEDKIKFICADINDFEKYAKYEYFDSVLCNPPYFTSQLPDDANKQKALSRYESTASLQQFITAGAKALKNGGKFFMIHKVTRLCDVLCALRNAKLEPKTIIFIKPKMQAEADTFIVTAKKCAKSGLITKEIVVMNEDGSYTDLFKELYS